jgi:hypothetical protein
MARIRVEIDFHLDVDIWLSRDCMAQSIRFNRDNLDGELRLPPFGEVGPSSLTLDQLHFDGYAGAASGQAGHPLPLRIAINQFRVTIRDDIAGISQADLRGPRANDVSDLISRHQQERKEWAERLAIDFLDRLRARGQTWLGPMRSISCDVAPHATTYEDDTNYRFLFGHGGTIVVPARPESADLDYGLSKSFTDSLAKSEALPLPELFLADADHFLGRGTQTDLQRAVLLAAIGCELKVKATLRTKVFPDGRALVEALLSNPRDFSMSAAGLFDKAMKAAVGRSLKEDDRALYKGIDNGKHGLFYKRNKIAHAGFVIGRDEAKESLSCARKVFAWLDGLPCALPS